MKLRFSPTSPYVRKVVVTAIELGLDGRIERIPTSPRDPASGLSRDNPLGKVPALITDEGEPLYDSPVICEYLASLVPGAALFPAAGWARWRTLRLQALADGVLDAAVLCVGEARRPPGERSAEFIGHQKGKIARALDALEGEAAGFGERVDAGTIAAAVTLGYLDFRFADEDWRPAHPTLTAWYQGFVNRPSMTASVPKDPA